MFLFVGRLIKEKGVLELVEAFNIYNAKHANAKLIIIGSFGGRLKDKIFTKQVRNKIANNKNIALEGYKEMGEIANYYKIAKAQIIPSMCNEAFGLVTLEAMLGGVRIIATDNEAFREICDNRAIYVSKDNIINDMVGAMERTSKLSDISRGFYSGILEKFTVSSYCAVFDEAIMQSIGKDKQ